MNTGGGSRFKWALVHKSDLLLLVQVLLTDLQSPLPLQEMQVTVAMISYIMSKTEFTKVLAQKQDLLSKIAGLTLKIAKRENDKKIYISCFWSFEMDRYHVGVFSQYSDQLVDTILAALKDQQSSIVIYESLRVLAVMVVNNNLTQAVEKSVDFYHEVFPRLFHPVDKIRKAALKITQDLLSYSESVVVLNNVVKKFVPDFKKSYCQVLNTFVSSNNEEGLMIWQVCIQMFDSLLHSGTSLINVLLATVEKGFKSNDQKIREQAFNSWKCLIRNFALDPSVLTSTKRLKLLIAPFKANNNKNISITKQKLEAWILLVQLLGDHSEQHFDLVIAPLLHFCFHRSKVATVSPSIVGLADKPNALTSNGSVSTAEVFEKVLADAIYVFHQIVAPNPAMTYLSHHRKSLEELKPIITQSVYNKHYASVHNNIPGLLILMSHVKVDTTALVIHLMTNLVKLLNRYLQDNSVRDGTEVLRGFFSTLSSCAELCTAGCALSVQLLHVLSAAVCGDTAISASVLSSRRYQVGNRQGI